MHSIKFFLSHTFKLLKLHKFINNKCISYYKAYKFWSVIIRKSKHSDCHLCYYNQVRFPLSLPCAPACILLVDLASIIAHFKATTSILKAFRRIFEQMKTLELSWACIYSYYYMYDMILILKCSGSTTRSPTFVLNLG